jgi:hypothetical protein
MKHAGHTRWGLNSLCSGGHPYPHDLLSLPSFCAPCVIVPVVGGPVLSVSLLCAVLQGGQH